MCIRDRRTAARGRRHKIRRPARVRRTIGFRCGRSGRRWFLYGSPSQSGRGTLRRAQYGSAPSIEISARTGDADMRRGKSTKVTAKGSSGSSDRANGGSLAEGRRVLRIEARAVQTLVDRLDSQFGKAVDLLLRCKGKVVVSGMGKSGPVSYTHL